MPGNEKKTGLLLIGHGTRSPAGTSQFLTLAECIARRLAPLPVQAAFLELQQPDIDAAIASLVEGGAQRILSMPLLLCAAGHVKRDVPDAVGAAAIRHGNGSVSVETVQLGHLGCHPAILELSRRRLREAILASLGTDTPERESCLVLVARGSYDESATAEMHEFARLLQRDWPAMTIEVAFLAMAQPLLSQKIAEVGRQFRHVVVQPHLLFHGELIESIVGLVASKARQNPEQRWITAAPLAGWPDSGPADRSGVAATAGEIVPAAQLITKVILDRCHEAGIHVVAAGADD